METKIYGSSDDLIEFDGDFYGEVGFYGTDKLEQGILLFCSDGTLLEVKYCKRVEGVWGIDLLAKGSLFMSMTPCTDADENPHSDVVLFASGLKWVYAASRWEKVS
jgi:hypothetical protein